MSAEHYALTLSCPDRPGIVAAVAAALFESGANIREAQQFNDEETGSFFARIGFSFVMNDRITRLRTTLPYSRTIFV